MLRILSLPRWVFYYYFSVHLLSHISGMGPGLIYMHFFPPLAPSLSRTHCGGQTPILCSPLHFFLNCNCCNDYFFLVLVRCLPRAREDGWQKRWDASEKPCKWRDGEFAYQDTHTFPYSLLTLSLMDNDFTARLAMHVEYTRRDHHQAIHERKKHRL